MNGEGGVGGGVGGEGGGGGGGGGEGGAMSLQVVVTWYLESLVRLVPSHASVAGKQQPLAATLSSAHSPMPKHATWHSSRESEQKRQPSLVLSAHSPPYSAAYPAPLLWS